MLEVEARKPGSLLQSEVTVGRSFEGWELALVLAVIGATLVGLAWPLLRAWSRRLEGRPLQTLLTARLEQLDELGRQLKQVERRCAELEQRVDFAERLLQKPAMQRSPTIER